PCQGLAHALRIGLVHLAAERVDEVAARHGRGGMSERPNGVNDIGFDSGPRARDAAAPCARSSPCSSLLRPLPRRRDWIATRYSRTPPRCLQSERFASRAPEWPRSIR